MAKATYSAVKCRECNRTTKDPNGLCPFHQNAPSFSGGASRIPSQVKSGAILETHKSAGWLSSESGIKMSDYSNGEIMESLPEEKQFEEWMKARVLIRAIESVYLSKGEEVAADYVSKCDDTSLALIWERLDNSTMTEFLEDGNFIPVVRQEVEHRVDSGNFRPMDVGGYINKIVASGEPRSMASFF